MAAAAQAPGSSTCVPASFTGLVAAPPAHCRRGGAVPCRCAGAPGWPLPRWAARDARSRCRRSDRAAAATSGSGDTMVERPPTVRGGDCVGRPPVAASCTPVPLRRAGLALAARCAGAGHLPESAGGSLAARLGRSAAACAGPGRATPGAVGARCTVDRCAPELPLVPPRAGVSGGGRVVVALLGARCRAAAAGLRAVAPGSAGGAWLACAGFRLRGGDPGGRQAGAPGCLSREAAQMSGAPVGSGPNWAPNLEHTSARLLRGRRQQALQQAGRQAGSAAPRTTAGSSTHWRSCGCLTRRRSRPRSRLHSPCRPASCACRAACPCRTHPRCRRTGRPPIHPVQPWL